MRGSFLSPIWIFTNVYRYGFQGQESDDEVKGKGNSINYKYRMHDPRIGRFFAIDPLAPDYPHNSPYAFSENKVIGWVELEGLEAADWKLDMIADQKGAEIHPPATQGIADANKQNLLKYMKGYGKGIGKSIYKTAEFCANPIETVRGLWNVGEGAYNLVTDPKSTLESIAEPFMSENPEVAGEAFGGLVGDAVVGGVVGYKIPKGASLLEKITVRKKLAKDFYNKFGESNVDSKLAGIDFKSSVQTITLKKGTIIQQWVDVSNGKGKYFSPDGAGTDIGVGNMGNRVLQKFELTQNTKVLKSRTKDFKGASGGDVQYFSPELKTNTKQID